MASGNLFAEIGNDLTQFSLIVFKFDDHREKIRQHVGGDGVCVGVRRGRFQVLIRPPDSRAPQHRQLVNRAFMAARSKHWMEK